MTIRFSLLPYAKLLVSSIRSWHPDWLVYGLLVDDPPRGVNESLEFDIFDEVVHVTRLRIPRVRSWLFGVNCNQACNAARGQMLIDLLDKGYGKIVLLGLDTIIFRPMFQIIEGLETSSIIIVPSQTEPLSMDPMLIREFTYNGGVSTYSENILAIKNDENGNKFARWWAGCLIFLPFVDRKRPIYPANLSYLGLVPGLFDGVRIERDPSLNVGYWNVNSRKPVFSSGTIQVFGTPLTSASIPHETINSEFHLDLIASASLDFFEIVNWHKLQIASCAAVCNSNYWGYSYFSNQFPITETIREIYRSRQDLMDAFENPYEAGPDSLYEWLTVHMPDAMLPGGNSPM